MFESFGAALREPLLGQEEERDAILRWQERRDPAALERLMRSHARQVWSQARRWTDNPTHLEDLVAEGMIGLMRAADNFDFSHDVRFSTYCAWWVRNELSTAARRVRTVIDLPAKTRKAPIDAVEGTTMPKFSAAGQVWLDALPEGEARALLETIPSDDLSPEEMALQRSEQDVMRAELMAALNALGADEAQVVIRRRLSARPEPIAILAKELGVSPAKLRQIETRALGRLRQKLVARGFSMAVLQ
ncbi:sigma-70 family RNA polymerase sigma factor [Litorisediminicola beolgyonensis]|uniref:Sigma-70 family RNA polymerase sigma factor n=1 Tax=Litorisediminicola beolgyonensis TaxID=1173614 RepID=A0ABW3ZG46_9RHOB